MKNYRVVDNIYCYEGTFVLKNKLDIRDVQLLEEIEKDYVSINLAYLQTHPIPGELNFNYLKKTHEFLFKDLYTWAGTIRTVTMAKENFTFANPMYIEEQGKFVFKQLKQDNFLKGLSVDELCERLAYYMSELNVLHPFREGNGRVTREFFRILAERNGYILDFYKIPTHIYLDAIIESTFDTKKLENLIKSNIERISEKG